MTKIREGGERGRKGEKGRERERGREGDRKEGRKGEGKNEVKDI